jgi:hypothetical protein
MAGRCREWFMRAESGYRQMANNKENGYPSYRRPRFLEICRVSRRSIIPVDHCRR